ncbi:TUP1-like enhancer of split protein (macronuclear) [Tetrahymena thermophila SB210]|uniref:Protein HIRA n=1 Tax=Tetrahymena thermophila (strain SB210) TaxID=312017 RepID=Q23DP2_TETTS|nr:TUP1-like enhancer of split protein [Tetrahymena thermophila SB210]EAR94477.1 TUP1-like enhancer of split protein [Tetrahymena thermophila SB210]|eukprot:XP_001014644.1 TUP1-like enhancer of split protein [Tetrahymena thermophila SB210]
MSFNVSLKYEVFSFHEEIIKSINFQNQGNVLVFCSGQDNDQLKIVKTTINQDYMNQNVTNKVDFQPLNIRSVQSSNLIKWSPNDQFLAAAFEKLGIWGYANGDIYKLKDFKDHELEIAAITWAPDSSRIASGGLDGKIVVRSVDIAKNYEKIKELSHDNKILGLVWDTYDKYLAALYSDNNVIIWKCNSWEKSFIVSLTCPISSDISKITSKRDDRKIDWSPDYRYVLVPSLDDKIVPFVCALDRQKDFKVCKTFMGPFSSINCVKFNPNLYENKESVINVFALGDNDGNISIWGIGDGYQAKKPFFLFKSHPNGNELIEDICWNAEGNMLIATTLKKYVFLALFGETVFGSKLSPQQKQDFLEGKYGTLRTVAATNMKFKVFKATQQEEEEEQKNKEKQLFEAKGDNKQIDSILGRGNNNGKTATQFGSSNSTNQNADQNQEVLTSISYTEQKTLNEGGKKRIIPSKQIISKVVVEKKPEEEQKSNENNKMIEEKPLENNQNIPKADNQIDVKSQTQQSSSIQEKESNIEEGKVKPIDTNDSKKMEIETIPVPSNQNQINNKDESKKMEEEKKPSQPTSQNNTNQTAVQNQTNLSTTVKSIDHAKKDLKDPKKSLQKTNVVPSVTGSSTQGGSNANQSKDQQSKNIENAQFIEEQEKLQETVKLKVPQPIPNIHTMRISQAEIKFLEIETPQNQLNAPLTTQIRCTILKNNAKEILWNDCIEGKLLFVEIYNDQLIYYTSSHLLYFVNSLNGRRSELPLLIPNICWLKLNKSNQMMSLSENGDVKVYDNNIKKLIINENIMFLLKENLKMLSQNQDLPDSGSKDPIENVTLDNNGVPIIFFKTRNVYIFNVPMKTWQKIDNFNIEIGCFYDASQLLSKDNKGDSSVAAIKEAEDLGQFFEKLIEVSPGELELENRKDVSIVSKYEERLIYLMKYDEKKSSDVFIETTSKYIKKLCDLREFNKIRQFIADFFCNTNTQEYQFMKKNNIDSTKLFKNIKRILDYFPYTSDLSSEIEEIIQFKGKSN